jgi:hypothetical protein
MVELGGLAPDAPDRKHFPDEGTTGSHLMSSLQIASMYGSDFLSSNVGRRF